DSKTGKDYLVISYRFQRESTSTFNWFMVAIMACFFLFGIFGYESSFWGIRGLMTGFGGYLTYFTLSNVLGEKQIWFKENKLSIKFTPLPWYQWNNNIEIAKIKKAVLKVRSNSRTPVIPWIDIKMKNGKTKKLLTASNVDEAKEIVAEINRALRERRGEMVQ
ncbi:MAG: hypothetical protein GY805_29210, partial [Chloroflexi bacterium]|nr:hypothetical protein [Chloroflexota bacterium]